MNSITKETVITATTQQTAANRLEKAWACMFAVQEITQSRIDTEGLRLEAIDLLIDLAMEEIGSLAEELTE